MKKAGSQIDALPLKLEVEVACSPPVGRSIRIFRGLKAQKAGLKFQCPACRELCTSSWQTSCKPHVLWESVSRLAGEHQLQNATCI